MRRSPTHTSTGPSSRNSLTPAIDTQPYLDRNAVITISIDSCTQRDAQRRSHCASDATSMPRYRSTGFFAVPDLLAAVITLPVLWL
jgi:hypothetical protein